MADSNMIGKTLHSFRLVSEIGEGGMGVVYLAEHLELHKRFAIKSLSKSLSSDPQFRQRFYGEAQKQAMLDHPNIVQVTDFFEADGQFFLVMEYVDGQDLSKLIKAKGKLPEDEALPIFQDVLKGLAFAHGKGLIHRDMKPSNVLIDGEGRARIMDFGIAIMAGAAEKRVTATGAMIGSPWYMSPEQIQRPKQLDQRTDIYSSGIVLYEMLAGDVPFAGETEFTVQEQQIHSPAPDLHQKQPEISQELAQIVRQALAKDPAGRFQTCAEFLERIRQYERKKAAQVVPPMPRWKLWVGGLAAVIVLALGIRIITDRTETPPVDISDDTEVQRQIAHNLVQTASEKVSMICRELERVKLKRDGLALASQIDSSTMDALKKQIEDLDKNISDAMPVYGDLIIQLVKLNSEIVDQQAEQYARDLTNKSAFEQVPMIRLMKRHYEQQRAGKAGIDVNTIRKDCNQALAKGA